MVAIFTGAGFGFARGSGTVLGGVGMLGAASQGRGGDGVFVNAATGNLLIQKQDEFLVGRGPDASVGRTYNSLTTLTDDNNDNWRQSTDRRVIGTNGASTIKRVSGDGSEITYTLSGSVYTAKDGSGAYDTITYSSGTSEWVWTDGDSRSVERYDYTLGRIKSVADNVGTTVTFAYDGSGRLSQVNTNDGSWIRYDWSTVAGSTNNITQIVTGYTDLQTSTAKTLTRTRYDYDGSNRLWKVTVDLSPGDNSIADAKTYVTTYGYDGTSKRVNSITQSDGSSLTMTFDASNRIKTLVQTAATGVTRTTTMDYFTLYSTMTDPTGQVTRLDYDSSNNLTKITAPPAFSGATAQNVQFAYNANGDVTSTTDARGKVTSFTNFTANGLAQTITDRLSANTTRTYDATNHLLSETTTGIDASGVAVSQIKRYVYNSAGDLRFAISAEGRVTEYVRNAYGTVTSEIDYVEAAYTTAGTPSEANMTTWTGGLTDKSWVQRTDYTYDARLNLTKATTYGIASTAGAGLTTQGVTETNYIYSQAGELLSTYATGQGATTYVYDGMGRVTAKSDAGGDALTMVFDDANTKTTITNLGGRTIVNTYNKAGDLITEFDGGTNVSGGGRSINSAVDKLGRTRVTSFFGSSDKVYELYDFAGRHTATIDVDGNITEYRYDANNRLVGTINYRNKVSAANLTTLGNPDNTLTIAGIRPTTHAEDTSSWTVYDDEGRVLQTIAGDGSTTISAYDASGRLQKTTSYVNKVAAATVAGFIAAAPTAVITPTADAADTYARFFYDKDGLLIGSMDGEKYVVQNTYDKSGQLVASTAFANATTAASPATASFTTILGAVAASSIRDRTTRHVYDGRGALRYTIDAVGNAVRFDYDAAGLNTRTVTYATPLGALGDYTFDNILSQLSTQESGNAKRARFAVYDSLGRLAYSLDQTGDTSLSTETSVTAYIYDAVGNLIRTVAYASTRATTSVPTKATMDTWAASNATANDRITRMWYNGRGDLAFIVDADGGLRNRDYDIKGRNVAETIYNTKATVSDTTTYAQVSALATGTWFATVQFYDSLDRVTQRYEQGAATYTSYAYHGTTNLVTSLVRAANGTAVEQATTNTVYDGAGRAIQVTEAAGTESVVTTHSFNGRGVETSMTVDPAGSINTTTRFTYDLNGRVTAMTEAYGLAEQRVTNYEYNAFGQVWKITDARGNISYSWYDQLGRVTHQRDAENFLTTTSYTAFGEVQSIKRWMTALTGTASISAPPTGTSSANDATTSFTYDKAGRVITSTDALSQLEYYFYNAFGDRTSIINRANKTTTYTIDKLGRTTRESVAVATTNIDGTGTITTGATVVKDYEYDTRSNVKKLTEGFLTSGGAFTALRTTNYTYDARSRVSQISYDQVTTIGDDMVTLSTNMTPTELFVYDERNNLIKSTDKAGARTFSYYDDLDRKIADIRELSTGAFVHTAYAYDKAGNLTSTKVYESTTTAPSSAGGSPPTVPAGLYRQTDFIYDKLNRMTTSRIVSNTGNVIVSGSWNGTTYVQNATSPASAGNIDTTYQYDANGNVVKLADLTGSTTWTWYDKLNRKTDQLDGENYLTHWTYDAEGNVVSETRYANQFTGSPSLSTPATVTANASNDRTTTYTYDKNGNRLTETRANVVAWNVSAVNGALSTAGTNAVIGYTYNALGQVQTKTVAGVQIAVYTYDGIGRLTQEQRKSYTDANGVTATPTTTYEYDAIGDLTRSTQVGIGTGTYYANSRQTTYRYGEGGRLQSMVDAGGNVHSYYYDIAGRLKKDAYARVINSNSSSSFGSYTTITEAQTKTYDLAGRVLTQAIYSQVTAGGTFRRVALSSFKYNNFDQVTQQGVGTNTNDMASGSALYQTTNQYDAAGRLVGTNSGDGVWKFFGYDKAGNQTVAVTSAGATFSSSTGLATALSLVANANVNGTYTVYDKRNQAKQVVEEGRELSASLTVAKLTTSRSYNAFGEVASETDALTNAVTYSYNTMGRMIRSESPGVQITNEDGSTNWIKPSEDYYYDLGGRLVGSRDANGTYGAGTSTAPASKNANTGNLTTMSLLEGTGYDGGQALVALEFHSDGSVKQTLYDVMGDARVLRDELYAYGGTNVNNDSLHFAEQEFNTLGQLTKIKHNRVTDTSMADDTTRLIDYYLDDQFGQRLQHSTDGTLIEKTDYDALGRISAQTDMSGYLTTTVNAWDGTLSNTGVGLQGVWVETMTYANGRTSVSNSDIYDRELYRKDLGNHTFTSTYDVAGRQLTRGNLSYTWYNTGLIATSTMVTGTIGSSDWDRKKTTYTYNDVGNRLSEYLVNDGAVASAGYNNQIVGENATYDALGRLTMMYDNGSSSTPAITVTQKYDAAGNIRHTGGTHAVLDQNGAVVSTVTDNFWYRYDAMNRLIVDRGSLSGGVISRGSSYGGTISPGVDYLYDAAGQRLASIRTEVTGYPPVYQEIRETYEYDGAGRIAAILTTKGTATAGVFNPGTGSYDPPSPLPSAPDPYSPGSGLFVNSTFAYDKLGRQTAQYDYQLVGGGGVLAYSRTATYADNGALLTETTTNRRFQSAGSSSSDLLVTSNTYSLTDATTGEYLLGAVGSVTAANYKNGTFQNNSSTVNSYQWWDGAVQGTIAYKPNTASGPTYTTTFSYDAQGTLTSAYIADGRPRNVTFRTNADGQVIRRDEADGNSNPTTGGDPHEIWYRFAGREFGYVGNNGSDRMTVEASIADRRAFQDTGAFRNGVNTATSYADFAQSSSPINSFDQGSAAGGYTVQRTGETLRSVAQQLWGDSSLWYKIAEANGMSGDLSLIEGQRLNLPAGISRTHHNAATLRPYDADDATGNISPTTPKPKKNNKCGVFGQILLAAVAIAVTVVALPAGGLASGWAGIGQGAAAGLAGGAASQAVGVATGIQSKFNFKGLAMSAIGGGVTAGVGQVLGQGALAGSQALGDVARGVAGSALTQGIGVATGLQNRFSWAGVAAAGVMAGVGGALERGLSKGKGGFVDEKTTVTTNGKEVTYGKGSWVWKEGMGPSFGAQFSASAASLMAGAATRSAIGGGSFGDNVIAMLPDALGQVVGRALGGAADKAFTKVQGINQQATASPDSVGNMTTGSRGLRYLVEPDDRLLAGGGLPSETTQREARAINSDEEIMGTVTDDAHWSNRGIGWKVADALGFHKGGFFYNLVHPSTWSMGTDFNFPWSYSVSSLTTGVSTIGNNFRDDYHYRLNGGIASMRGGWAMLNDDNLYSSGNGVAANLNTLKGLSSIVGGAVQWLASPISGPADTIVGRSISALSNGAVSPRPAGDTVLALGSMFLGPEVAFGARTSRIVAVESGALSPMASGRAFEAERRAARGLTDDPNLWRPGQADIDSAAFNVIVGKPKYTPGGQPVGTIFDSTQGGFLEIKSGSSVLDSNYQLRLQTYRSLKTNTPYTIETSRPINPSFKAWLDRWGVNVAVP